MAYAYNVDYWDGKSQLSLAPEMLQLRYANYPKDYFMGMLPSSQYGSVATLASSSMASLTSNHVVAWVTSDGSFPTGVANPSGTNSAETYNNAPSAGRGLYINSDLSALSIRAVEYLQRWKEVVHLYSFYSLMIL